MNTDKGKSKSIALICVHLIVYLWQRVFNSNSVLPQMGRMNTDKGNAKSLCFICVHLIVYLWQRVFNSNSILPRMKRMNTDKGKSKSIALICVHLIVYLWQFILPSSSAAKTVAINGVAGTFSLQTALSQCAAGDVLQVNGSGAGTMTIPKTSFNGVTLELQNGSFSLTPGTSFANITGNAIFAVGIHDSHLDGATFTNVTGTGIMAYPGNNNTFDHNTFVNVFEPIHIFDGNNGAAPGESADNLDVSHNAITGASRNGIELQSTLTHLTVCFNYIGQWNPSGNMQADGNCSHMAISCATGGRSTAPYGAQGEFITIANNTLLLNGRPGQTAATSVYALTGIEIMGDKNISIAGNYASGCGLAIMNGTAGAGANSSGNIFACVQRVGNDATPWKIGPVTGTDSVFAWNDPNAPAAPTLAATVGAAMVAAAMVAAAPVTTSAPAVPATAPATQPSAQPATQPTVTHRLTIYSDGSVQEN